MAIMDAQKAISPVPQDCEQDWEIEASTTARKLALRALSRRDYSVFELRCKLERHHEDVVVEPVLDELIAQRLLSDERFTETFVRSRIERGQGPMRIRQELSQRGISDELTDAYLTFDTDYWTRRALQALEKRSGLCRELNAEDDLLRLKARARVGRFLAARGYPADVIHGLLRD